MPTSVRRLLGIVGLLAAVLMFGTWITTGEEVSAASEAATAAEPAPEPVDDDMHHFMEYVFEPSYKRLRAEMAKETKDKAVWKAVKGDALTLAECANLLLLRAPDVDADDWRELSTAVRTEGSALYQAARKSDADAAKKAYLGMLTKCNACHEQFAGGEHQLQP
jgi:hypothetical protein